MSEISFDVAMVALLIANINAALATDDIAITYRFYSGLICATSTHAHYCYDIACQLKRYMFILPPEVVKNIENEKLKTQ